MKSIVLAAAFCIVAGSAFAQSATCKSQASDKKLAGAAMTSFMKKCESDALKTCDNRSGRQEARRRGEEQLHQEMRRRRGGFKMSPSSS